MDVKREDFFKFVNVQGPQDCWLWEGTKNKAGQGIYKCNGKYVSTGWIAWILAYKTSTTGKSIRFTCGNKLCTNPTHLFLEESTYRKLTGEDARTIRTLWRDKDTTLKKLADLFDVSAVTIRDILLFKTWKGFSPSGKPVRYPKELKK